MDYTFISGRILSLLETHNITEYELSMQLGRCKSYINKITSGKSNPSMTGLFDICAYFDITLAEFFSPQSLQEIHSIRQIGELLPQLDAPALDVVLNLVTMLNQREKPDRKDTV